MNREGKELAIVTGASSGIGMALARELAASGTEVLAVARRGERLEELEGWARSAGHARIHPLALDVTEAGAARAVRDRARELGGASWLVNNAGTVRFGSFLEVDGEAHRNVLRLNCESLTALCAEVVPDLVARGAGRVLNVGSMASFQPTPYLAVYGATKAFVLSFSEGLAEELQGTGVTVTALCPGPVTTEIFTVGAAPGKVRQGKAPGEISAEECARFALAAARRGEVVAIPGAMNRAAPVLMRLVPRSLVRRLAAKMGRSMAGLDQ